MAPVLEALFARLESYVVHNCLPSVLRKGVVVVISLTRRRLRFTQRVVLYVGERFAPALYSLDFQKRQTPASAGAHARQVP